jgi:hypothetical protein
VSNAVEMKPKGSVITKIVTRLKWVDGVPEKIGDHDVAQLRVEGTPDQAAEEVPGLEPAEIAELKENGFVVYWGEHKATVIRVEVCSAVEYELNRSVAAGERDSR